MFEEWHRNSPQPNPGMKRGSIFQREFQIRITLTDGPDIVDAAGLGVVIDVDDGGIVTLEAAAIASGLC